MRIFRPIWAEINCDNLTHNFRVVRGLAGETAGVTAVVKADAYGHGAVAVVRVLAGAGADMFAVASLEEALELRGAGLDVPVLVLGYTQPAWASEVVANGIRQTVYHYNLAQALSREAVKRERAVKVHVKVDTGMGRIGVFPENAVHFIEGLAKLPGIEVEGVFTHLSCADVPDDEYTVFQLERFSRLLGELERAGIGVPLRHAANSAGILRYPDSIFNMVRPGIMLHGLFPSERLKDARLGLKPVMAIKSTVIELKTLPAGSRVSYGGTFRARRRVRVATLPAGYADGFGRRLSNRGSVIVEGRRAPIVGNVCMDFMVVDVTGIPDVKVGDEATLIGRQGGEEIGVDETASLLGTINYEVVSLIGKRVPRVYINYSGGNPAEI
ncbi:MAG: alanine racemase [bacterium]